MGHLSLLMLIKDLKKNTFTGLELEEFSHFFQRIKIIKILI